MITEEFIEKLSSKEPVPGGGGVAALAGALAASLAMMVANLTSGKKKYAQYQEDIERILDEALTLRDKIYGFIEADAAAFEPLSKAYSIPKEEPGRDEILQNALYEAAVVPLELTRTINELCPILTELAVKGSRLAISDVAVAASMAEAAARSAVMNVYINTGLMTDKDRASSMNEEADRLAAVVSDNMSQVYKTIRDDLKK